MEDSEKVEIVEEKPEESETKPDESEKLMEKPEEPAVASVEKVTSQVSTSESIAEAPKSETDIPEVSESEAKTNSDLENVVKVEEKQVEIKIVEVKEAPKDPPIAIEECDTGGDEIPDVPNIPASLQATVEEVEVETEAEAVPECEKSTEEPVMLAELTTFVPEQDQHVASSDNKPDSDVVALDDDDDDVEDAYDTHNIDDSEDQDDEDDEDVEGVSNEALNDEDEEVEEEDDEEYLYGAHESKNDKPPVKSSQEQIEAEEIDDEDDYDEDDDDDRDDEDMIDLKDDSMGAVVIGSSDEDEPPVPKTKETTRPHSFSSQLSSSSQPQSKAILMQSRLQQSAAAVPAVGNTEDIELDYDEDDDEDDVDDDDDDEYDDDDLMNAVVTSASKGGLSPPKKRPRSESPVAPIAAEARQREAHQIIVLTRRINYGRIAKKKSLNWLYNKKKREAYKSILPKHKPRNHTEAMRSDQSGGLLHLKISSPSVALIGQKAAINPSTSTPIIARLESTPRPGPASRTKQIKHKSREDIGVIELDSSPEKTQDNLIHPRQPQSDDQRKLDFDLKKSSSESSNKSEQDEGESTKMQQTDKVRDSIQKSTEEVEGVKSAQTEDRLKCEQNKENLQSNEALKKESDDTTAVAMKVETEAKDASALPASTTPQEDMDTSETNESTMKAASAATSSLKVDIKEEKPDTETSTPADVATASKVTIEDVPEREAIPSPHPVPVSANKRRRSSSAQDKPKTPKIVEPNQDATGGVDDNNHRPDDDEEEYIHPTKKLREELQTAYPAHDRILNEYIEKTSNDSVDTIQRHIDQMISEIHTLNDMIKAKEVEWNNMLHLKKVKEEIYFRLTRRKQCLEIMSTKVGETGVRSAGLDEDYHNILAGNESAIILGGAKNTPAKPNTMQLSSTPIQAAINTLSCNFTTVSSSMSSTTAPTTAQLIIQNRANMKSSDLVKEKANTLRLHRLLVSRNILPKPTNTASPNASITGHNHQQSPSTNGPTSTQPNASNQPILNSYLTSTDSVQQLVDMMNGHHNNHTSGLQNGGNAGSNSSQAAAAAAMVGRQGPFKDVRSIIADFRQQHPEVVPRRGRRVKTTSNNNSNLSDSNSILGNALKSDTNSRPSSNDSSSQGMSNQNQGATTNHNHSVNSFKDVLAPFSKSQGAVRSAGGQQQNPPYPEVTLHPVSTPLNASGGQDQPTGSLLHGILTKFSRPTESANTKSTLNQASANYISNFSPTLARLLTAPERISPSGTATGPNQSHHNSSVGIANSDGGGGGGGHHHSIPNFGVNLSKVVGHNSEITITPVMNSMHQQSILQQQLQQQQLKDVLTRAAAAVNASNSAKDEHFLKLSSFVTPSAPNNDDDAEDSVDRLVIDEGDLMNVGGEEHQKIAPHAIGQEFNENEVPVCQGCKKHEAQFVCAGCGNQWYCSRECQVTAWDDHSEVCTATKQIRNNFNMLKSRDLDKDEEYLIIRRRKKNKFLPQFY